MSTLHHRLNRLERAIEHRKPTEVFREVIVEVGEREPSYDEAIDAMIARGELDESQRDNVLLIVNRIVAPPAREAVP